MKPEKIPKKYFDFDNESFEGFTATMHSIVNEKIHWHDFFEFELVISGRGINILNGISESVSKGSLIFVTPSDFHEIKSFPNESISVANIHFNDLFISDNLINQLNKLTAQVMKFNSNIYLQLEPEFMKLLYEYETNSLLKKDVIKNCLDRILLIIIRNNLNQIQNSDSKTLNGSIELALSYIEKHYTEDITLEEVANICHFSTVYFSKSFHRKYGETFQNYLIKKRLHLAENILKSTDLSISQICYETGFNCHTYFTRSFKKQFNITPSKLRKEYSLK